MSSTDDGRDEDFHLKSTFGRSTGALAPVTDPESGLPVDLDAMEFTDTLQSPAIDLGDPSSAFSAEPAPNGGYVNLGAYGNTSQASR